MHLSSPAFASQAEIPIVHTCQGEDRRPPLAWTDPPKGTRSFALIVDDPDAPDPAAPKVVWVHWVAYDLPPSARELAAGAELPPETRPVERALPAEGTPPLRVHAVCAGHDISRSEATDQGRSAAGHDRAHPCPSRAHRHLPEARRSLTVTWRRAGSAVPDQRFHSLEVPGDIDQHDAGATAQQQRFAQNGG